MSTASSDAVRHLFERFDDSPPNLPGSVWAQPGLDPQVLWHSVVEYAAATPEQLERAACRLYVEFQLLHISGLITPEMGSALPSRAVAMHRAMEARGHQGPSAHYVAGALMGSTTGSVGAREVVDIGSAPQYYLDHVARTLDNLTPEARRGFVDAMSYDALNIGGDRDMSRFFARVLRGAAAREDGSFTSETAAAVVGIVKRALDPPGSRESAVIEVGDTVRVSGGGRHGTGIVVNTSLDLDPRSENLLGFVHHVRFVGDTEHHAYGRHQLSKADPFPRQELDRGTIYCPLDAEQLLITLYGAHKAGLDAGAPLRESDHSDLGKVEFALHTWSGITVSALTDRIAPAVDVAAQRLRAAMAASPGLHTLHHRYTARPGRPSEATTPDNSHVLDFTADPPSTGSRGPRHPRRPPQGPPPSLGQGPGGPAPPR
ncbi:hypothetical protein [Thermomonospora umbrina]|uniref:Uncharacterized protein n=1 Tax=Thermomonospora umbrina TaxID=111806 RepID=A0A3D9SXG2_9ACTN|nr:hypothetical protein [Thermomonospora umbrina]REF00647.1 hypothetical protein DFJ69_6203 [Thermomonospora umbrina]